VPDPMASAPITDAPLTDDELAGQRGEALPTRELMSLLSPTSGTGAIPGLAGTDTSSTPAASPTATPGADTAGPGTSAAHGASTFTPPPTAGTYSSDQTSSSST